MSVLFHHVHVSCSMFLVFQQGAVGFQRSFIDRYFAGQFAITYPFVFRDICSCCVSNNKCGHLHYIRLIHVISYCQMTNSQHLCSSVKLEWREHCGTVAGVSDSAETDPGIES